MKNFDFQIIAYDPYQSLNFSNEKITFYSDIDRVFSLADVVSVHLPALPETNSLIAKKQFELLKKDAVFINTSRGSVIDEQDLIEFLQKRSDVFAFLDVTQREPLNMDSELYNMSNVFLTPHISGGNPNEFKRNGDLMLREYDLFIAENKLQWEITMEMSANMA